MSDGVTKAIILAAGKGSRLRPLTLQMPKVLLPVGGIPLIRYTLSWLESHGISEVAINLHHFGGRIRTYLGDGSVCGVKIYYSPEKELLGTAGGVKRMEKFLNTTFVVVYGDVLTDFDLSAMVHFHKAKKTLATLALLEVSTPGESGIVEADRQGRLVSFKEKPRCEPEAGNLSNGAVYVLEKEVLDYIPSQSFCDFGYDIFPKLLELDLPVYGYVLKPEDYLIDVGTLDKYHKANEDIEKASLTFHERSSGICNLA